MIQQFTWKIIPPAGETVDTLSDKMQTPAGSLMHNPNIKTVELHLEEDHIVLLVQIQCRDRWWGKRKMPYLVTSVLVRSGLRTKDAELTDVHELSNLKSARFRTEDGRRTFDPPEGETPKPRIKQKCKACKQPGHWYQRSGWHNQYHGRGR